MQASFVTAPGFDFVVTGARPASDSLRASVGGRLSLANGVSILTGFEGDFARTGSSYSGNAALRIEW